MKDTPVPAKPSLRELNRLDKLARIKSAAKDLFAELGFDRATTRDIARRAHVGLGTLFNYADDKRDLVFLIFNEELNAVTDVALAAPHPDQPLIEQLLAVFRVHYRWLGSKPALARILLQELTFYSSGKQASTFLGIRKRLIDGIEQLIEKSQKDRKIKSSESAGLIARHIFFVYSASLRWWIAAPRPDPQKGLADLRRLLKLQFDGLHR